MQVCVYVCFALIPMSCNITVFIVDCKSFGGQSVCVCVCTIRGVQLTMYLSYYLHLEKESIDNNKKEKKKKKRNREKKENPNDVSDICAKFCCCLGLHVLLGFFSNLVRAFDSHAEGLCSNPGHNGQSCLKRYM